MAADNLTPKQEAFARAYVETGNASEAYRRAYNCKLDIKPKTVWEKASHLLAEGKVAARVAALKAKAAERTEITVADIAKMLQDAHLVGAKAEDAGAMTEAAMSLAKLLGHYVETKNVKASTVNHNIEERVSPTSEWIEGVLGGPEKASPSNARPN